MRIAATTILLTAALASSNAVPTSAQSFTALGVQRTIKLPYQPGEIAFSLTGEGYFVAEQVGGVSARSSIHAYELEAQQQTASLELNHAIEALALSADGAQLYAAGSDGVGMTYLTQMALPLGTSAPKSVSVGADVFLPTLTTSETGDIFLGGATTSSIYRFPPPVTGEWGRPSRLFYPGGTRDLSTSGNVLFANSASGPLLTALNIAGSEYTINEVGREGLPGIPLTYDPLPYAFTASRLKRLAGDISFVVADYQARALTVVDFDPKFRALEVAVATSFEQRLVPGLQTELIAGSTVIRQPLLLSADPSQRTILLSNLYSLDMLQYSRVPSTSSLELLTRIELPGLPSAIAVHPDGGSAIVALAKTNQLLYLDAATAVTSEADRVREVQRALVEFGYDIGAIDGVLGPATNNAIRLFQEASGAKFDARDLEATLAALTPRELSPLSLTVLKELEGMVLTATTDGGGSCYIGYGHLVALRECEEADLGEFAVPITEERALQLFQQDLVRTRRLVEAMVPADLSDDRYGALVSFAYNVGPANLRSSTLLRYIEQGDMERASQEFGKWVKAGGNKLNYLVQRRECEAALFSGVLTINDGALDEALCPEKPTSPSQD